MGGWHPGIGDPTVLGWFTVAAYAATALLSYLSYRSVAPPEPLTRTGILAARVRRRFWLLATAVLVALGVNKQLDLQSLLTEVGRTLAKGEGWYESRRLVQEAFVAGILACGGALVLASLWAFRRGGAWVQLGQLGLIALCSFVVVRAASFHHIDVLLGEHVGGLRLNHILELGGLAVIAVAGCAGLRRGG